MTIIQEIYQEYIRMRDNGMDAKEALRALRSYIEPLDQDTRQALAQRLRSWENGERPPTPSHDKDATRGRRPKVLKPLKSKAAPPQPEPPEAPELSAPAENADSDEATWVACQNCGAKNRKNEVFCYRCGHILDQAMSEYDTKRFANAEDATYRDDYFGPDSVLVIEMRETGKRFELRPQARNHEMVIGRSTGNRAMMPDVDLSIVGAADLGVSRLHMAIKYEGDNHTITCYDLGSANGTFINGQRLNAKEVRILRRGDEVRVGRLVMRINFFHPGSEV